MIAGLFIFGFKGEMILSKVYRQEITRRGVAERFRVLVINNPRVNSPITSVTISTPQGPLQLYTYYIKHEDMYLVATSKENVNVAMVFEFLYRFIGICINYFGHFDEDTIKQQFALIYELLDEVIDFGFPQNCDPETLKSYITGNVKIEKPEQISKITIQATGANSWRRPDIKYRKNEMFIDVIESVNVLIGAKGNILQSEVQGKIMMKAYLTGTPECKFGLNDKMLLDKDPSKEFNNKETGKKKGKNGVQLDDCQFHQCVRLGKFQTERTISFVPPDGEFELMKYRTTENINIPFKVTPTVYSSTPNRLEYKISLKALFSEKFSGQNITVKIPVPPNTVEIRGLSSLSNGSKAKFVPNEHAVIWK
eukprot:NODE_301_length_11418_cov_0.342521.p2 type:complete len:366 gc:universal NODE_301_length_11418_cov_0.342521:3935-5032(+)